ncbi:MAG: hypothetical protein R2766_13170 [Saprospiraceae bacterium]
MRDRHYGTQGANTQCGEWIRSHSNYSSGSAISKSFGLENGRFDTDYHIYAIEWGIDYLEFLCG